MRKLFIVQLNIINKPDFKREMRHFDVIRFLRPIT